MSLFKKVFWTPKIIIPLLIIMIAVIGGGYLLLSPKAPKIESVLAQRKDIVQEVSVTGQVKSSRDAKLAFKNSGKVVQILTEVGNKVTEGQILIRLDNAELQAQLKQKQGALEAAEAQLAQLQLGQDNNYQNSLSSLRNAFINADDAVNQKTNNLFTNPNTQPQLSFITLDSQARIDSVAQRLLVATVLPQWSQEMNKLTFSSPIQEIEQALNDGKNSLEIIQNFLARTFDAVNLAANLDSTTKNTYLTNLTTARTNINTAYENLNNQIQAIALQKTKITSQQAEIKQTDADIDLIQAKLADTVMRSPFNGLITKVDIKLGEMTAANQEVISVIAENALEIETNIPEVDITKVKIGDEARVTLDAFGNDVIFQAKVIAIDPAETVIEGVATYKTTLQFAQENEQIKPGMTANINIMSAKRENVIVIPQRAVITKNGDKIVNLLNNDGTTKEAVVETGLRGSDGNIEIIKGLKEGDQVVISNIK